MVTPIILGLRCRMDLIERCLLTNVWGEVRFQMVLKYLGMDRYNPVAVPVNHNHLSLKGKYIIQPLIIIGK